MNNETKTKIVNVLISLKYQLHNDKYRLNANIEAITDVLDEVTPEENDQLNDVITLLRIAKNQLHTDTTKSAIRTAAVCLERIL